MKSNHHHEDHFDLNILHWTFTFIVTDKEFFQRKLRRATIQFYKNRLKSSIITSVVLMAPFSFFNLQNLQYTKIISNNWLIKYIILGEFAQFYSRFLRPINWYFFWWILEKFFKIIIALETLAYSNQVINRLSFVGNHLIGSSIEWPIQCIFHLWKSLANNESDRRRE